MEQTIGRRYEAATLSFAPTKLQLASVQARDRTGDLIAVFEVKSNGDGTATLAITEAELYGTGERTWGRYAWSVRTLEHLCTILECYRGTILEPHADAVIATVAAVQHRQAKRA